MKISIPLACVFPAILILVTMTAVDAAPTRSARRNPARQTAAVQTDTMAIHVNELSLSKEEFFDRVNAEFRRITRRPDTFTLVSTLNDTEKTLRLRIANEYCSQVVMRMLLISSATSSGLSVSSAEIDSRLKSLIPEDSSIAEIEAAIVSEGGDVEDVRTQIRNELLVIRLMEQKIGNLMASETEARLYYKEHPEEFLEPETVRARHILLMGDTALEEITRIKKSIDDGAKFEEMAVAHSACPSAAQGGDLGYFPRGLMVQSFEEAAFSLAPGVVSEPVLTNIGYHLIKVEDHLRDDVQPFGLIRDRLIAGLSNRKKQTAARELIAGLREKATIKISIIE